MSARRLLGSITTAAVLCAVAAIAAAIATWSRYESFDPCVWMEQDAARESRLPRAVVRAKIRGEFLLRGIGNPDSYQCLQAWWKFRADNLPDESSRGS
jgi:hypothetical protein